VAFVRERRGPCWVWWRNIKVRTHLKDLGIDGNLILKWGSNESLRRAWTRLIWLKLRDKWREIRVLKMRKVP
jgi:hypothetical protein